MSKGGGNAAINYGAATVLEAKTQASDANVNRQIFLTFDLAGITGAVNAAILQLNRTAGLANVVMTVYQCNDVVWSETGINWNNKPALGASITATMLTATNGWYTSDVGSYVTARKAVGATAITFACVGAEQGGTAQQVFSSKEGLNKPVLQITYQSGPVAPVAPTLSTPPNGASNQVTNPQLAWNNADGASSYTVQLAADAGFGSPIVNASTGNLSQSVNGLSNAATYYWRVNATNSLGTGPWSTVFNFTTVPAIPAAPVLSVPADGAASIATAPTLAWLAVSGAATYRLQVSTDNAFASTIVDDANLAGVTKTLGGLAPSTTYYWRVNAKNAGGTGAFSTVWSFTTRPLQPPVAPTLAAPANASSNVAVNPTLSWNVSADATEYTLQVSADAGFGSTIVDAATTSLSKAVAGLGNGTTYYWRVGAANTVGTSPWSAVFSFTTVSAIPLVWDGYFDIITLKAANGKYVTRTTGDVLTPTAATLTKDCRFYRERQRIERFKRIRLPADSADQRTYFGGPTG
jgi:hypothetical protein